MIMPAMPMSYQPQLTAAQMPMAPQSMAMSVLPLGFQNAMPMQALLVPVTAVTTVVAVNMNNSPFPSASSLESIPSRLSSQSLDSEFSFSRSISESTESELGDDGCIGRVWDLSQRTKGCRQVQQVLEDPSTSDAARSALALELQGKVRCCARSACGNYVLQKVIQVLRPQACQFIIDEIMEEPEEVSSLAKHQYACRILQRLLENCQAQQMEGIIRLLLQDAVSLVRHNYGTFVMQEVFDFGTETQRQALGEILLSAGMGTLGNDENATQVLQKALLHAPQKVTLAQRMVPQFAQIARGRHSHQTVLAALQVLPHQEQEKAIALLSQKVQKLWASRYGRLVVKAVPSLHQQCVGITRREAAVA